MSYLAAPNKEKLTLLLTLCLRAYRFYLRTLKYLTQTLRWPILTPHHSLGLRAATFTCRNQSNEWQNQAVDDEDVELEEEDDEEVPPAEARRARSWRRFLTASLKASATEARRSPREATSWPHLPLLPERPGKTDWHLEKTLMTLFNKRWASSREGQCCSRMSDTVFVKTRWRSWPRSENGLDLGDMGNYWQKHLWLTRCLREAYAVLTRMLGNNFAKYSLNIPNVSSRKGIVACHSLRLPFSDMN